MNLDYFSMNRASSSRPSPVTPRSERSEFLFAALFLFAWCAFFPVEASTNVAANAESIRLNARLVWGTNGAKPPKDDLTELNDKLKSKLQGVFKWKNYFQCHSERFEVSGTATKRVKLSDQCEIEVENQGGSWVEVKLYGEGKLLVKKRQVLTPGELLILAGDGKNDTAWFVVLALDPKAAKS